MTFSSQGPGEEGMEVQVSLAIPNVEGHSEHINPQKEGRAEGSWDLGGGIGGASCVKEGITNDRW